MSFVEIAKQYQKELITLRRDFHKFPEIGFEVENTAEKIYQYLSQIPLTVKKNVSKTGVVADLIVPNATKTIALRADMDALPIQELTDVPYKSTVEGKAHLCGHDAHMAILLVTAKILAQLKDELKVNVRFIFQPSEEVWPGGAPGMIEEGALDSVDEIYALHVWPTLNVGEIGICDGPAMAQADGFSIKITGKGGHAAIPCRSINPIYVGCSVIDALQKIVSQTIPSEHEAVLTVTQMLSGTCYNAIPEHCVINGTVRTFCFKDQQMIKEKMSEIIKGLDIATKAKITLDYLEGYPVTFNHCEQAKNLADLLKKTIGPKNVIYPAKRALFGEDFAYYLQKTKGAFLQLGCKNSQFESSPMLHDPYFTIDEDCLVTGVSLWLELISKSE